MGGGGGRESKNRPGDAGGAALLSSYAESRMPCRLLRRGGELLCVLGVEGVGESAICVDGWSRETGGRAGRSGRPGAAGGGELSAS